MRLRDSRPDRIPDTEHQSDDAHRRKDPQRTEDRDDPQQNQEELDAIAREPDLRPPGPDVCLCRLERHAVACPEKGQRRRRGCREAVREEMEKLTETDRSRRTKSRREVRNGMTGQKAGELREQPVAESPADRRLGLWGTRADHQVVLAEACDKTRREGGSVLSIGIENDDELARRLSDAGLHGRAVALVVGVLNHVCAGGMRRRRGTVVGAVVDDKNFVPIRPRGEGFDDGTDTGLFVVGWDHDRGGRWGTHASAPRLSGVRPIHRPASRPHQSAPTNAPGRAALR